jgi:hypothetical protein
MTTLRDFLAAREAEIRDQQKALKAELRDLQIAKAALEGNQSVPAASALALTIKEMARAVLAGQPNGLNSSGILDGIKKQFARDIERTSLSPQLSRLKEDGELTLSGEIWYTTQHWDVLQRPWGKVDDWEAPVASSNASGAPPIPPMPDNTDWEDDGHPF